MGARRTLEEQRTATVLVHLAAGVGNVVLATPLVVALDALGFNVDVLLDADYAETADLLRGWSIIRQLFTCASAVGWRDYERLVPAVPPFYWWKYSRLYTRNRRVVARPREQLFYEDEQEFYLSFARALGSPADVRPVYRLPITASDEFGVGLQTLVVAPGSKGGEMRAKRWGGFARLAELFDDVAVVGTSEDLRASDGTPIKFPTHARLFTDQLTLKETARLLASAGVVVASDCGLAHVAAATGTPTVMIFGPTPHRTLGRLAPNVTVLRAGLQCEPCWFGARFRACDARLDCLREVSVEQVARTVGKILCVARADEAADESANEVADARPATRAGRRDASATTCAR